MMKDPAADVPRRGRPRVDVPGVSLSTWLTTAEADQVIQRAQRDGQSVSSLIRAVIILTLHDGD
jgi:hypothetical protein